MKIFKITVATLVMALLVSPLLPAASAKGSLIPSASAPQDSLSALQRGWRTGYSDGYQSGYGDSVERAPSDFKSKEDYQRADRAYVTAYGPLEDYRDGYQQGFETGYAAGYERRGFDSTVPPNLSRRGTSTPPQMSTAGGRPTNPNDDTSDDNISTSNTGSTTTVANDNLRGTVVIPRDTFLRVELLTILSTEASQEGDRFQARVMEPAEYQGAMVDGRVTRVKRPGRAKGKAELQLAFEQIRLPDNRWTNLNAQLVEVIDSPGGQSGDVDEEGGVKGKGTTKGDIAKIGTGSAIGAIIGAIAGGGKGAAIGAAIGGGIGSGAVLTQRGNDIYLPQGQQLRLRTNSDVRIQ